MQSNLKYKNEIHSQTYLNVHIKGLEQLVPPLPSRLVTTVYLIYPSLPPKTLLRLFAISHAFAHLYYWPIYYGYISNIYS